MGGNTRAEVFLGRQLGVPSVEMCSILDGSSACSREDNEEGINIENIKIVFSSFVLKKETV